MTPDPPLGRVDYDAELRAHNEVLRRATDIRRDDRVLDIGCGTGQTTRDAAGTADNGTVLGVDVSAPAIERARSLSRAGQLRNIAFEVGDAQVHPFPPEHFDIAISRFGTMFFTDPAAAFTNISCALRPGGRLVMMVWQEHDSNDWAVAIDGALTAEPASPRLPVDASDPFSLSDRSTVEAVLGAAGFGDVSFAEVHEPVYYGPDIRAALEWTCGFSVVRGTLQQLDAAGRERALRRLERALAAGARADGVFFESRAWIVTARRKRNIASTPE